MTDPYAPESETDDECTNKACERACPALATPPAAPLQWFGLSTIDRMQCACDDVYQAINNAEATLREKNAAQSAVSDERTNDEPAVFITPLMEQQMFDDWCPYKGNPDPRTVWAAAIEAVNGLLLTRPQPAAPAIPDLQDRLVAVSEAIANQDDWTAQAILGETLRMLAAAPEQKGGAA